MEIWERLYKVIKDTRGVEEQGGWLRIPQDVELELYVNTGSELAPITRVSEVKTEHDLWIIKNTKSETFYFPSDRIVGLKINDSGKRRGDAERGAGFTRGL